MIIRQPLFKWTTTRVVLLQEFAGSEFLLPKGEQRRKRCRPHK